jgi:hypothetical protein
MIMPTSRSTGTGPAANTTTTGTEWGSPAAAYLFFSGSPLGTFALVPLLTGISLRGRLL